jgi:2-C-methyl-D-erythritol 4-phosphate cytidylyltransferase
VSTPSLKVVVAVTSPIAFQTLGSTSILAASFATAKTFAQSIVNGQVAIAVADASSVSDFDCEILICDPNNRIALAAAIKAGAPCDVVAIHDSQRPLTTIAQFQAAFDALTDDVDAVRPVAPFTETLKAVDAHGNIVETIDRTSMMRISTPEIIRVSAIDFDGNSSTWSVPLTSGAKITTVAAEPESLRVNSLAENHLAALLADSR